jgi:hypothetical protein
MSMTVACPGCAVELALGPEMFGQVLACPKCSTQFRVASGPAPAQPPAAPPPPAAPVWRGEKGALPGGFKLNESAAPAPAQPQVVVPRFKPLDPASPAVSLTQGGTLPEFSLADTKRPQTAAAPAEKQPQTLMLTLIVAASLTVSVCLSLIDLSPTAGGGQSRQEALSTIATFYGRPDGHLEPYQLLLRAAQRAHSRGDVATERAKYREVLRLLRAENRTTSVTETHEGDQQLEAAIAIVLAEE